MQKLKGLALLFLPVIAGCASLGKDECLNADWRAIGYEDGANGAQSTRIGSHREACAKYDITPELQQYKQGHEDGLAVFCTGNTGYSRALNGYRYTGVCPKELEADFLDGYSVGREIYLAASEVDNLERRQQSNEREQDQISKQLRDKEAALFDSGRSEQQRRKIYDEISQLNERQGSLQQERDALIRDLADAEIRLQKLRSDTGYY